MFHAIVTVRDQGKPVNILSICDEMDSTGQLAAIWGDSVKGRAAITEIHNESLLADSVLAEYAITELANHRAARETARIGERMAKAELSPTEAMEALQHQVKAVNSLPRIPRIRFYSPSELKAYEPETNIVLIGDCHIMRGETFVIGGEPGVGKSRAATSLAVAGAMPGATLFGMKVHRQFRTMIVQTENGRYRLRQEYGSLTCDSLDDWIRVSEPPPFGLTLTNPEFQQDIRAALESFKPDCVILDPWNAAARDDKARDYSETFDALRSILPTGSDKPALGIVAHTKKPQLNEKRNGGTNLMHLLSGSYILTSNPRSVFIMVRGSDEETGDSVVWFNPKNNNGPLLPRSAWHRLESGFTPDPDFDWTGFDQPPDKRARVELNHLEKVFGSGPLELKDAAHALASLTGINDRSAYNALSPTGRFKQNLKRTGNIISLIL